MKTLEELMDTPELCKYCPHPGEDCCGAYCEDAYQYYKECQDIEEYASYYHMQKIMRAEPMSYIDWCNEQVNIPPQESV